MTVTQPKPPRTQRAFATPWGELDYLCKKIRYWLYVRKRRLRAARYLDRLAQTLRDLPENDLAIIREEGQALFHELKGDLSAAAIHRRREIQLTERLHKEAQSPRYDDTTRAYMLRDRGIAELQQRCAILASLKEATTQNHRSKSAES